MRVSVSELTGNAKTPKNIVTSDEQDTLGKVLAFEGKEGEFDPLAHNLAEEKNLRLDKYDTKTTQDVNTQKAPANTATVEIYKNSNKTRLLTIIKQHLANQKLRLISKVFRLLQLKPIC